MKIGIRCSTKKSEDEFYKHSGMTDGILLDTKEKHLMYISNIILTN